MAQNYQRDAAGIRFEPGGISDRPPTALPQKKYAYLQNVRSYISGQLTDRSPQGPATFSGYTAAVTSMFELLDTTPGAPGQPRIIVGTADGKIWLNTTLLKTGLSGAPLTFVSFRPNASPQPWVYIGDANAMWKVRSDGTIYKVGIAEPQIAPTVSTQGSNTSGSFTLQATAVPWNNVGGVNSNANYGQTSASDGTGPGIIGGLVQGATLTLTVTGSATVNGATHSPGDTGPTTSTYPGHFAIGGTANIVLGAFTDGSGNVVLNGTTPYVYTVGASATLTVPAGAMNFQVGVDSSANTFSSNSGSFSVSWTLTTAAVATVMSTSGPITAYVWGDSPHSGPVAEYIWRNASDSGTGIIRSLGTQNATATGNSLIFDSTPEDGTVPVQWTTLNSAGSSTGSVPLFSPALESQGFQDFNAAIVGNLFVPTAGTYTFTLQNKDQVMFGIGGSASFPSGSPSGPFGQTKTAIDALPLCYVSTPSGGGGAVTGTVQVSFPTSGIYPFEFNWDYWFHSGRKLIVQSSPVGGGAAATIPPLSATAYHINTVYRYTYRSSKTGAVSNPSPASGVFVIPLLANAIISTFSTDPQVDLVDYYRMDSGLSNFTYVATGPNDNSGGGTNTPITDSLTDAAVAANPTLQFDNFEPFPSIDLPRSGKINVGNGGVISWVSGDQFNVRWLPGTIILIGSPASVAYTFIARPTSTTTMTIPGVTAGSNVSYYIAEPLLAAQPLPYVWGPTDNSGFMFGCGDPLRGGTQYWTKGNNLDSAPDTNQQDITSPGEPLQNGCITAGLSMVFSTERPWLGYPNFSNAESTTLGVTGSAWNFQLAAVTRGLFMPYALCTDGGKTVFFRAKDGIFATAAGAPEQSITDDIASLFPHESTPGVGTTGTGLTIGPFTVPQPNDADPDAQTLCCAKGFLYYDYETTGEAEATLVYDMKAGGWIVDSYGTPVSSHLWPIGPNFNNVLTGCTDGSIRPLVPPRTTGTETATAIIATGAIDNSDQRALKRLGDVFIKANLRAVTTVAFYKTSYATALSSFTNGTITGIGNLANYICDFLQGTPRQPVDIDDIALSLTWSINTGNIWELWQPNFIPTPETIQGQPTDWDDMGSPGNKYIQGLLLELDTFNSPKTFSVERSDDLAVFTPNECPVTVNGQNTLPFSFTPPFIGHMGRIISVDSVPWRKWGMKWIFEQYPEAVVDWHTEYTSHGKEGWLHIPWVNLCYASTAIVTLSLAFDTGASCSVLFAASAGKQIKQFTVLPAVSSGQSCKFQLVSYRTFSTAPFYLFKQDCEIAIKQWGSTGPYETLRPFGGPSFRTGALV